MTERQGVEIDYCSKCRGVWLDRGELDKIVERSRAGFETAAPPPTERIPGYTGRPERRDYDHDDDRYHGRRRKNWLEDLFD
jgi:Zn-finger nucleic acid-binding protein